MCIVRIIWPLPLLIGGIVIKKLAIVKAARWNKNWYFYVYQLNYTAKFCFRIRKPMHSSFIKLVVRHNKSSLLFFRRTTEKRITHFVETINHGTSLRVTDKKPVSVFIIGQLFTIFFFQPPREKSLFPFLFPSQIIWEENMKEKEEKMKMIY